jgi:hypothetical protein
MPPEFQTVDCAPRNYNRGVLVNQATIDGNLLVYGITIASTNDAAQYALIFDASTLPAEGAVPSLFLKLAADDTTHLAFTPAGRHFEYGLVICTSSTDATKTLNATADTFIDVQYDFVVES